VDLLGSVGRVARDPLGAVGDALFEVKVLREAGLLQPLGPAKLSRVVATLARWGMTPATGAALAAIRTPDDVALCDEIGSLTYEQLHRRSNALARGLTGLGVRPGDGMAIMCRNHRGFVDASLAGAKLGASVLYLNTAFAGPQLVDVMKREGPQALVYDDEFADLLDGLPRSTTKVAAWCEGEDDDKPALERLISENDDSDLSPPGEDSRFVILTSGTTGTPKGAQRGGSTGIGGAAALMDRIPYRSGETMMIAAPMFHSWGFLHFIIGLSLGDTLVMRRRFDPEDTLRVCDEQRVQVLAMVPVMMQRILGLPEEKLRSFDLSSLRIAALSGSALPGELAIRWMDLHGDTVYNLYGSTEVAFAAIADPADLRAAPGTAGRPPRNTIVKILDENGDELPQGETGRIFVGSDTVFEGYTGGGGKEEVNGLLSSGDVGYFDQDGHLFVAGRDDEMIVSGGENVFPREVEDLLTDHERVTEVAVIGIDDQKFGQRLKAYVVASDAGQPSEDELKGFVKENLARYKVPREIVFLEELPRNATGKVLKRELRERED
jgi:acyl-CoA synthetase (AMP-forming)/AMP-acid ligase II